MQSKDLIELESIAAARFAGSVASARTGDGREIIQVLFADGLTLALDPEPAGVTDRAARAVAGALHAALEFTAANHRILRNHLLSEEGKAEELRPHREAVVRLLAETAESVLRYQDELAALEGSRYAPPQVIPDSLGAYLVTLHRDREIRDYLRQVPDPEWDQLVREIGAGTANEDVLAAILRSPIGNLDHLLVVAQQAWREAVDRRDPGGRAALDLGHQSADWALRAVYVVAATTATKVRLPRQRIAELTSTAGRGWRAFGLSAQEVEQAVRWAEHRRGNRAA